MVDVKPISEAKDNYVKSTTLVRDRYEKGIKRGNWKENAGSSESEQLFAEQMQKAISNKSRQKGISKVSEGDWRDSALEKGAPVIAQNMKLSSGKWADNVQPFLDVMEGINLPAKVADVEQNIMNRSVPIAVALRKKKEQLRG